MYKFFATATTLLMCALGAPALAQTEPSPTPSPAASPASPSDPCGSLISIVNRPSIGTGVCTVRTGHVDLENGYENLVTTGPGGGNTVSYPQSLLRVGTADPHLDFEIGPVTENRASTGGSIAAGMSDLAFGAKYELGYSSRALWGVNTVFTVPTGTSSFGAGNAQFTGNFNWGYTLSPVFSLSGTLGFNAASALVAPGRPQSYFNFMPTLMLGASLPGGPSQMSVEYAYFTQAGPNVGGRSYADVIYARDFGTHVQFDVEYGFSPTPVQGQRQHYVGAGLSFMN